MDLNLFIFHFILTLSLMILIFVHALRIMNITDFQLEKINVFVYVSNFNSYAYFFLFSEFLISLFAILGPVHSKTIFTLTFSIFFYEFVLYLKGKLFIEVLWAARTLNKQKAIAVVKIISFFICILICIMKMIISV